MSLPGQVEEATPSLPGFDSNSIVSLTVAQQFYVQGYRFCLRYISRGPEAPGDLGAQEAMNILTSGLALMPVQHCLSTWSPNQTLGQQYGQSAVANAQSVGFPAGINVWCDLEGVIASAPAQDVIAYCEDWFQTVNAAGYVPGLYVGANPGLTGQQLYDLSFQHYWRSSSSVPDIPIRGYQLFQFAPSISINGVRIDLDVAENDRLGGQAHWLRVSTSP